MPEIPDCLARRYKALDELIKELTTRNTEDSNEPGVKLMCNFWNILKENPDCDLTQAIEQRMGVSRNTGFFQPNRVSCYMAGCCKKDGDGSKEPPKTASCCKSNTEGRCHRERSATPSSASDNVPLSKVLCNIKEAASFDKKCQAKVSELLSTQKELQEQIGNLEQREKEGIQLLKQADCMWTCMEASYKKQIAESLERQQGLLKQMKEIETSVQKWRKNKKDLEFQMDNIAKCQQEIKEKMMEKNGDLKCITLEIEEFNKRIKNNKNDVEATNKSFTNKKNASSAKLAYIAAEITRLENQVNNEKKRKMDKEKEGSKYIKEAREDLQKLCKVLLQKKLENEDLNAEKQALLLELEMLNQTCDQCKDKCRTKQQGIEDEILAIDKEIANFKVKCIRCHECTDTNDMRKYCTDCPKCAEERNCILDGDTCNADPTMDCVCMSVKKKFLDNVFENMYTVLERQTKTGPGKAVADAVLNCLKKSRNGKLNDATKKILQDFILNTVKKNLNLTIVGGAVKTRCEMDQDTYKQLMLCLKQIKVTKPAKADKGTPTKKDPCRRWPGSSECNCPSGPKDCICTKRAPPPPRDPTPCPEDPDDKEDPGEVVMCPHKDSTPCGPDCAMHTPSRVAAEVSEWKPNPCQGPSCKLKNMRAAQCVLGPQPLCSNSLSRTSKPSVPFVSSFCGVGEQKSCQCTHRSSKPCLCHVDTKQLKEAKSIRDKEINTILQFPYSDKQIIFSDSDMQYEVKHKISSKKVSIKDSSSDITNRTVSDGSSVYKGKKKNRKVINIEHDSQMKLEVKTTMPSDDSSIKLKSDLDIKPSNADKLNIILHENDQSIKCTVPNLSETPSGNISLALDSSITEFIDSKLRKNSDLFAYLIEDKSGQYTIDFRCKESGGNAKKLIVKRTPSGNMLLDVDTTVNSKPKINDSEIADRKKEPSITVLKKDKPKTKTKKTQKSLPKEVVDNCSQILCSSEPCSLHQQKSDENRKTFKATLKGLKRIIKEPVILCQTDSDTYNIILDKEFENYYKEAAKCHEGKEEVICVKFLKTKSNRCILSFDEENDVNYKNAYLTKLEDGSIKLIVDSKENSHPKLTQKKSSISSKCLQDLFNRELALQNSRDKLTKPNMKQKSCSDSNIYNNLSKNLSMRFTTDSSVKLTKTNSGHYTVVLDKESRKSFVVKLQKYLCGSSKGLIPIKREDNGEISIALNNDFNKNNQYASLALTASGNIYVTMKDRIQLDRTDMSTVLSSHSNVKWEHYIDEVKNPSVKAISTTCNGSMQNDGSCDIDKCVCKNIQYKSKRWFVDEDPNKSLGIVWQRDSGRDINCDCTEILEGNRNENKNPHIIIKSCNEDFMKKYSDEYKCFTMNDICPRVQRYKNISNDFIEISGSCTTEKYNLNFSDSESIMHEQQNILNRIKKENMQSYEKVYNWDSIEHLPHQLPPFLKEFSAF